MTETEKIEIWTRNSCQTGKRRAFTLVELMVAMTILVLLMLMLFQFLLAAQRLWSRSEGDTRIYETSRVVFDVLERDIRASITSVIPDKQIGFYLNDPTTTSPSYLHGLEFCIVSSNDPPDAADSKLCEVSYKYFGAGEADPYTLKRQVVADNDPANWDFCGRPANWYMNNNASPNLAAYETLADGVLSFSMKCYSRDDVELPLNADYLAIPNRVEIQLTLCDPNLINAPATVRFKTQRSFTKIFYLGDLQTN